MAVELVLSRSGRVVVVDCAASLRMVLSIGIGGEKWVGYAARCVGSTVVKSRLLEVEVEVVNSRMIASRPRQITLC